MAEHTPDSLSKVSVATFIYIRAMLSITDDYEKTGNAPTGKR